MVFGQLSLVIFMIAAALLHNWLYEFVDNSLNFVDISTRRTVLLSMLLSSMYANTCLVKVIAISVHIIRIVRCLSIHIPS